MRSLLWHNNFSTNESLFEGDTPTKNAEQSSTICFYYQCKMVIKSKPRCNNTHIGQVVRITFVTDTTLTNEATEYAYDGIVGQFAINGNIQVSA